MHLDIVDPVRIERFPWWLLPYLTPTPPVAREAGPGGPTGTAGPSDPVRVLVIDDNPSIHDDFRKILAPPAPDALDEFERMLFPDVPRPAPVAAFEVDVAHQGAEGLSRVEDAIREGRPYALAFVDVRMPPGWDGIETTARLWEVDPDLQVVICTAYSDHTWSEVASRLGEESPYLILRKPFDNAEVRQLANGLSRRARQIRALEARIASMEGDRDQALARLRRVEAGLSALGPLVFAATRELGVQDPLAEALVRAMRDLDRAVSGAEGEG